MAKKISVINMKGGVGKSTISVNLAWHYAYYMQWRKRVLVVDLDPQFNASQYLLGVSNYETILRKANQQFGIYLNKIPGHPAERFEGSNQWLLYTMLPVLTEVARLI